MFVRGDTADPLVAIGRVAGGTIAYWHARVVFEKANRVQLINWETSGILQSDCTRYFDRAIRLARRAFGHKGGWLITRGAA